MPPATAIAATIALHLPDGAPPREGELAVLRDADGRELVRFAIRAAGRDPALREWDEVRQNYLRWAGPDGTAPVLEATVAIARATGMVATAPASARLGVPMALLGPGPHAVWLRIRAGRIDLSVDGRLADEDWPCGGLPAPPMAGDGAQVWPRALDDAEIGLRPEDGVEAGMIDGADLQYWAPPGHNRWAGDTMMLQDGRRLHLFYLIDRRHHGSKGGAGAHQIAHLSTADLRSWQAHPLAVAIEEPWEVLGTGGAVMHEGRCCILYGLHTDRVLERAAIDPRGLPSWSRPAAVEGALPCAFGDLAGAPQGAALAVADDGVHFRKEPVLVHAAQNPSVFPHPEGGWALFAGYGAEGLFRSDDLRAWRLADSAIIPQGEGAPARNSLECICHLEWNGWHYLFGGRTGFWMARAFAGPYWHRDGAGGAAVAQPRWDIYDGLWVPMVAALADGRRILSGWLEDRGGWAGCLVLRELLQEADGTLAMRWPRETLPRTHAAPEPAWGPGGWPRRLDAADGPAWIAADGLPDDCLIEVAIAPEPGAGAYALVLGGTGDLVDGCELRLDPLRRRAQWNAPCGGRPAAEVPDQAEIFATPEGRKPIFQQTSPHLPFHGGDFAITGVEGLDRPLTVRLRLVQDRKSGSAIIDAEIGGRRTMITRRRGLAGRRLHLMATAGAVSFGRPVVRVPVRGGG